MIDCPICHSDDYDYIDSYISEAVLLDAYECLECGRYFSVEADPYDEDDERGDDPR